MTDASAAPASRVERARELVAFCDALVGGGEAELAQARAELLAALGPEGLVDAAAVASNFERMVRIADGCGIPLDGPLEALSGDLRDELHLARFASSANTPQAGPLRRAAGRLARPLARRALQLMGRRRL